MNANHSNTMKDNGHWKPTFSLLVLDFLVGSVVILLWYLLFDIHLGMGGRQEVMPDAYLHAGLLSWVLWELVILSARNRFQQPGAAFDTLLRVFLVALALFAFSWLLLAGIASRIEVLDPHLPAVLLALHLALAAYFLLLRPGLPSQSSRLFGFTSALVMIGCSLLATEGLLRLSGKAILALRLQAEPEDDIHLAEDGVYRILCIGDSNTRGIGAPPSKSYPRQLQEMLERTYGAGRFQVVNAGIPGSNSSDGWVEFLRRWEQTDYHVVLVWTGINNLWSLKNAPPHLLQQGGASRLQRLSRILAQRLGNVRLFRLVQLTLANLKKKDTYGDELAAPVIRPQARIREQVQQAIRLLSTVPNLQTPEDRFTPEQMHAFQLLALPRMFPQPPYAPLQQFAFASETDNWTAREWTLHGWAGLRLSEHPSRRPRMKSLEAFWNALEMDPSEYWAWIGFARTAWDLEARQTAELLFRLEEKHSDDPVLTTYLLMGLAAADPINHDPMVIALTEDDPDRALLMDYFATNLMERDDQERLRNWLGYHKERWEHSSWWRLAAGWLAWKEKDPDQAYLEFLSYLELSQDEPIEARCRLAKLLVDLKDPQTAQKIFSPEESFAFEDPRLDRWMIQILLDSDRLDEAIEYGERCLKDNQEDPDLSYILGRAYVGRRRRENRPEDLASAMYYLEKALAQGYPFRQVISRLMPILPGQRFYLFQDILSKRYGVTLEEEDRERETPIDRRTREAILLYDLNRIRQAVWERNALLMILNYPPRSEFDATYQKFSDEWGIPLVDNARHWQGLLEQAPPERYFAPDGHPNADGYSQIARLVMQKLVTQESFEKWIRENLHTSQ